MHLLFFMTPGNGLATWQRLGTVDRELRPYRAYLNRGWKVTVATFDPPGQASGGNHGLDLAYCPPPRLLFTLPWYLHKTLRTADLLKTNQSLGAWWYVLAAKILHKPILLRCGYVAGEYLETVAGPTRRTRHYQLWEGWAFRHATFCQVPTPSLRQWVCSRYRVNPDQTGVVPNFVDTHLFAPLASPKKLPRSVIFVGNFTPVKNLSLLVKACAQAGAAQLSLVGDGPDAPHLVHLAERLQVRVKLHGRVPNQALPEILQQHEVYAQTSLWEGHPKALLEAMACGMPCVATRAPGLREAVEHGVTGLLCDPDPEAVATALQTLFANPGLRHDLGAHAARSVGEQLSFEMVFEKEWVIVNNILAASPAAP